ncbi:MAG: PDDEXK nuclease domain-containing protein [Verrucomicrobiota bacterium]|jgi:predicted nuclease of restriction endonuclease-like (RecB) superfamily
MKPSKAPEAKVTKAVEGMLPEIRSLIEEARHRAVRAANLSMVTLYWNIGRVITTELQNTPGRAGYGEALLARLGDRLKTEYGRGFSRANLQDMRRFHAVFEIRQPVASKSELPAIRQPAAGKPFSLAVRQPAAVESGERLLVDFAKHYHLGWTHYRMLLGIGDVRQRRFYFEQACHQRWSKRELQRQIAGALFERVALSSDTRALIKLEKQKGPPEVAHYREAFKDPYLLDFLGLTGAYSEKDLEAAIISNLQQFLTELGSEFCFIRRQYPMRVDDEDYFLDLLFYHRGLRCLVAVDLKIGAFVAADKGQMDLYLSWLKRHEWRSGENEPVGLILCTSKKRQHVELLLAHGPHKMQVSEYLTKLPDKKVLEDRLKLYGRLLEEEGA